MKNLILMALICLAFLFSCATTEIKETAKPVTIVTNTPKEPISFVHVTKFSNFSDKEKEKALLYIPVMDKTLRSVCFSDFLEKRVKLHSTNGKTAGEVVDHIRKSTVNIELIMYYKYFTKVHGYTEKGANWIKLNRKYHTGASLCSEASNLAHELSHKIGYGHAYKSTVARPYSVPYSINAAFIICCN